MTKKFHFITCSGRICHPPAVRGPEHTYFVGIERNDSDGLPYKEALQACLRTLENELAELVAGTSEARRVSAFVENLRAQVDDPSDTDHSPSIPNGKLVALGIVAI